MIPLTSRIHSSGRNLLDSITTDSLKFPPVLAHPISRRWELVEHAARVLTRWQLERLGSTGEHPDIPEKDAYLDLIEDGEGLYLSLKEDITAHHLAFLEHGLPEASTSRSALASAALELWARGKPEELLMGLDDDTIADISAIGRINHGPLQTSTLQHAQIHLVEDHLPVALIDRQPLITLTQTRPTSSTARILTGALLQSRAQGYLSTTVLVWFLRSGKIESYNATQLLNIPLEKADEEWQELLIPAVKNPRKRRG